MENRSTSSTATGGIVNAVKDRATAELSSQKGKASDQLGAIATAVRQSTEQLRNDKHDVVAQYIDKAADQLDRFSRSLRERELDDILRDVQSFARRQPAVVIGGSFVVGMLAARFLKSSSDGDGHTGASETRHYGTAGTDQARGTNSEGMETDFSSTLATRQRSTESGPGTERF